MFSFILSILIVIASFILPIIAFIHKYRKSAYIMIFSLIIFFLNAFNVNSFMDFVTFIFSIFFIVFLYSIGIICWLIGYLNKK